MLSALLIMLLLTGRSWRDLLSAFTRQRRRPRSPTPAAAQARPAPRAASPDPPTGFPANTSTPPNVSQVGDRAMDQT